MKKQIIMILSLIFGMHACAMPQYLEQLPEDSKIRELYMQQKKNTTNAKLLKHLKNLDSGIQKLVNHRRIYGEKLKQGVITNDEYKKQNKECDNLLTYVFNSFRKSINFCAHFMKTERERKALITQEQTFLEHLLHTVWYKPGTIY